MRRKIEKYLAKKQGVDEASIRYTEDGRFDFMGDLDGVLNAVRGRDSAVKPKKISSADRTQRTSSSKKTSSLKKRKDHLKMAPLAVSLSYMPYGMAPPPYPGMPPHPMYSHELYGPPGTESLRSYPPYTVNYGTPMNSKSNPKHLPLAPKPTADSMSPNKENTSSNGNSTSAISASNTKKVRNDPMSSFLASSQKSYLTSPKAAAPLNMTLHSPEGLNIHGMTPLSTLRGTFETIYDSSEAFNGFSHEENMSLNKALFADDDGRKYGRSAGAAKTPCLKTPRQMNFSFCLTSGASNSGCIKDMKSNRVSISPLACKGFQPSSSRADKGSSAESCSTHADDNSAPGTGTRSIHFSDTADVEPTVSESVSKTMYDFMPNSAMDNEASTPFRGVARTPCGAVTLNSIDSKAFSGSSPFAASLTPIGFDWGRQLGFSPDNMATSFTPFKSPAASLTHLVSRNGRNISRSPLMTISANVIPKSTVAKSQNKRALPKATEDDEQEKMVEQGNDMVVFSEAKRPRLEEAINQ
jgi:hypothetical protein